LKGLKCLLAALLLLTGKNLFAQGIEFVENKGQWDDRVRFKGSLNGGAFFLTNTGYKVLLTNKDDMQLMSDYYHGHLQKTGAGASAAGARSAAASTQKYVLRSHAYEVTFVGSTGKTIIVPDKPVNTVSNYYIGNDSTKWATGCKIYQAVVYKNIYPNIDARYYVDDGSLKYDIIVNPGGDVDRIALQFDGADKLDVKNQNLVVKTSVGEVAELRPYTFQSRETGREEISSKYSIKNNIVKFRIDNYDKTKTLIIDPTLVFSSFSGSRDDNWGYTATYDGAGNFYGGGIVFGSGFPVSNGAFQTSFGGGDNNEGIGNVDIGLIKLSANGSQRLFATYLGGNGTEQPHSLVVDNNGDLIVAGRTWSSNFPQTQDRSGPGGDADIFITKFDQTGTRLIGSRLFGGTNNDGINIAPKYSGQAGAISIRRNYGDDARSEVIVDAANNIYLASCTQSSDFPVSANAFQKTIAGKQDGVFIKTNPNLSNIIMSTYLGGAEDDAAFVLGINPSNNNIYIGGSTASSNFPGVGNGAVLQGAFKGGVSDGFVTILSNDGSTLIKSTYVGTDKDDMLYGLQFDKFAIPYIMGTTTSDSWPVVNAAFSQAKGKQFIGKLKADLSGWEYSTVFGKGGGTPDISPVAFLVDRCENVYVSGWGGGINQEMGYPNNFTTGLTVTPNAIQKTTDGSDFYYFVLKKNAESQLYGTFFGERGGLGDHVDGGTSRFDRQGVIYTAICANCNKQGIFPITPGVWGPTNLARSGSSCNLAMVKIAFELAGVATGIRASIGGVIRDTVGCIPLTVDFTDTIAMGKSYIWDFGDNTPRATTTTPNISHTFNELGTFRVMLISIDSAACNIADTSYTHIIVKNNKANLSFLHQKLDPCDSLNYLFTNTSTAPANVPFKDTSFLWDLGDGTMITSGVAPPIKHTYASAGRYTVILNLMDTSYCNFPEADTAVIRIATNVKARFVTPASGCAPYDAVFDNQSDAGQSFEWDFGDGSARSSEEYPVHHYETPGVYTVWLWVRDNSTCNKIDSSSFTITVSPAPTAAFSYSPVPPQENTQTTFVNLSTGAVRYTWFFGDGDSLNTVRRDTTVAHIYNATGTYKAELIAYNQYGCSDTASHLVDAIVVPLVDVPNAFTPNGDGVNDNVYVKGYGITKMAWRIYNRWGTLIYIGNSQKTGWDGKYKGVLQPQEVYTYVLDVEFTDGQKYQKKGDITLLR